MLLLSPRVVDQMTMIFSFGTLGLSMILSSLGVDMKFIQSIDTRVTVYEV